MMRRHFGKSIAGYLGEKRASRIGWYYFISHAAHLFAYAWYIMQGMIMSEWCDKIERLSYILIPFAFFISILGRLIHEYHCHFIFFRAISWSMGYFSTRNLKTLSNSFEMIRNEWNVSLSHMAAIASIIYALPNSLLTHREKYHVRKRCVA